MKAQWQSLSGWLYNRLIAVPVRLKITGIIILPVVILGFLLNFWVTSGLSDWLSHILTDVRVEAAMDAGGRSVVLVTFLGAALSIILGLLLNFILTRPLLQLRDAVRRVAAGEYGARARIWANDEIGELSTSINTMLDHMVANQNRLEIMNRVAMSAGAEVDIHDALYTILKEIVSTLDLRAGWVYLRDPERDRYHLASWYGVPEELQDAIAQGVEQRFCDCLAREKSNTPQGSVPIYTCRRLEGVRSMGHSHISIPIESDEQNFGVISLICRDAECDHSKDDLEVYASLGAQISEIVANAWFRMKLNEKEAARQLLLESLVKAQEEERARLGRELHDGAGQTLTGLLVHLKALEQSAGESEFQGDLSESLEIVSTTIQELRQISHRLRPAALDELGLETAVLTLLRDMCEDAGLRWKTQIDLDDGALSSEVEIGLYRIAQECVTNALRHAQASDIALELVRIPQAVSMSIEDNGMGFDPDELAEREQRGMGLLSMQERTELLGGSFEVFSTVGEGTLVRVRIPVFEGQP